jgi:hypothetical protein
MRSGKVSCFLFFLLLFILGDLLKNASCLVGCLTPLEESNELERVSGHRLIQVRELELMRLGLCKEGFFTLLLRCGYFHHSTKVTTLKIAEKLYSTPHELMHWHESRLLGSTNPADQLAAYIGEPGNGLKVVPDTFIENLPLYNLRLRALLCDDAGHLVMPMF